MNPGHITYWRSDERETMQEDFRKIISVLKRTTWLPIKRNLKKMLESETKTAQIPYRFVGKGGGIVWLEDHFLSYRMDGCGHALKLIAYTFNVTTKHEKELESIRLAEHNKKIIETLPEFIFIFDNNFFIKDVMMALNTVLLHPVEVLKGAEIGFGTGRRFGKALRLQYGLWYPGG